MTSLKTLWVGCTSLFLLLCAAAQAEWVDVQDNINMVQSRPAFDRVNRLYTSYVNFENTGDTDIAGPFRVLIEQPTLVVVNEDGVTAQGSVYMALSQSTIAAGATLRTKVQFALERKQLSFQAILQQDNPHVAVYAQAEGGDAGTLAFLGSEFTLTQGEPTYVSINQTDANPPADDSRVVELDITFTSPGEYALYARLRVGPDGANDDSFYAPDAFGSNNDWISVNNISGFIAPGEDGYQPGELVVGGGSGATQVWKWLRLPGTTYQVPEGQLMQKFRFGGREDGLDLDKFAFAKQGVLFTIEQLENGQPGVIIPPPPPFVPQGPPMAQGQNKFVGGVCCGRQRPNFEAYFNQVTPENGGKWGSVESTRDLYNWAELDAAYNLAKTNNFVFKHHVLVWGNQQPPWISALPAAEQLSELLQWFNAVNDRYASIDFIEVVNEFDNDPPDNQNNGPGYIDALRLFDPGTTNELVTEFENNGMNTTAATELAAQYDWIINAFQMARNIFPPATKLMINEYSVINTGSRTTKMIEIVNLLKARNLIDAVGFQGHAFSTTGPSQTMKDNIDRLGSETGLDLYVTELDIDGPTDVVQLVQYQRIFPLLWQHPAIKGITLWGYLPGHWRENQGAHLALENGAEKPALVWLRGYVRGLSPKIIPPGNIEVPPETAVGTVVTTLSSTAFDGGPHDPQDEVSWSIIGGSAQALFALDAQTAELTVAGSLTPALHNLLIQVKAGIYTSFLLDLQVLIPGDELAPIVIEYDFIDSAQGWRGDYGTTATVAHDPVNEASILIPDWASNNQSYIKEISLTDFTNATLEYSVNVTPAQVAGGLTVQGYIQTGAPNYSRIYGAVENLVAGSNRFSFSPADNGNLDIEIIERVGFQLNGPLTQGQGDNVLLENVTITIPVTAPPSNVLEYDFVTNVEGWRGDYGTSATVIHDAANEAAELLPNGVNTAHNYIKEMAATDFTGATVEYTMMVTQAQADSGLTAQGYVQTGDPNYSRIYGGITNLVAGRNTFSFIPLAPSANNIKLIQRVALQLNGSFSGTAEDSVLMENVNVSFP